MASARGWLGRLRDMPNDRPLKTVVVTLAVALTCSVLVASAAVLLKPLQVANKEAERRRHIVEIIERVPGLGERLQVEGAVRIEPRVVDLATGDYVPGLDATRYDQRRAARETAESVAIPPARDAARIKQRARYAVVYLVSEGGEPRLIVLPVHGAGYASTLYGYLGLTPDAQTVVGLGFYEHAETPGLGALVDTARWRRQWTGKRVRDEGRILRLGVADGPIDPASPNALYQVDALTGATWTGRGVTNLLRYWLGDHGFGPYLRKIGKQGR